MPLQFPAAPLRLSEHATERAMHTVIDATRDFEHALVEAQTVAQVFQIKERITACVVWLTDVQDAAMRKADRLSEAKN